jgi:hypothetical protein
VTVVAIYDTAGLAKFDRGREVRSDTPVNMGARRKGKRRTIKMRRGSFVGPFYGHRSTSGKTL